MKLTHVTIFAAAILLPLGTMAEVLFEHSFEKGISPSNITLTEGRSSIAQVDGTSCLKLTGTLVCTPKVKLDPKTKYKLTIIAKYESDDALEENEKQVRELIRVQGRTAQGLYLPTWDASFFNDKNQQTKLHIFYPAFRAFYSNKWLEYTDVFYPAPNAVSAHFRIINMETNGNLFIRSYKLETVDEPCLNLNPEFSYGEFNFSGYSMTGFGSDATMTAAANGKFNLNVNSWIDSDPIPVEAKKKYTIEVKYAPGSPTGEVSLIYFDGKLSQQGGPRYKAANGVAKTYTAPAEARYIKVRFIGKGLKIESLKVNEKPVDTK